MADVMCTHDPQYRKDNEQAGGVGCPVCNAENRPPFEPGYPLGLCAECTVWEGRPPCWDFLDYVEERGDIGNDPRVYSVDFSQ